MIPIPVCLRSRQRCFSVCIYQECQLFPFICYHCEDRQCQTIHIHHGKRSTKKYTEIANYLKQKYSTFNRISIFYTQYMKQYYESNQYIIRCLQNRQYSKITGKSMRSLYDSMIKCTNTKKQEKQFQYNQQKQEEFYLSEGQKMFKQKKYQNALELFEKLIAIDKNYHKAHINLLNTIQELKKQNYFIQKYSDQIKIDPNNSVIYLKRGCLYYAQDKYEDSLRDFDKSIQLDENYSVAHNYRANAKYCLKEYQQSFIAYSKAIEINPKYSTAYYNRARLYRQKNDIQNALSDYNKAIKFNPKYFEAYNNRALIYQKKKQWQLVVNDYTKAIQINPFNCDAFNDRGIFYYMRNETQKALNDYNKAIDLDPLNYNAYCHRALTNKRIFKFELALEDYNKAIQLNPYLIDAYYSRAKLYYQKKQYDAALIDYSKVIQLDSNYWQTYKNRAVIYEQKNELQMAVKDMIKVMQLHYSAKYLIKIGQLYFKLHNYQSAGAHFVKYLQLEEQNSKCDYYLGRIELEKGNLQLSSAYLQKSIQVIAQSKPQYFLNLGIVKDLMEENDNGNDNYEIAFGQRLDKNKCLVESLKQIYKEIRKFRCDDD